MGTGACELKSGPCERCAYNRPERNLEELLGFPDSPGITQSLERLRELQEHFIRAEAAQKRMLEEQGSDVWPAEPKVAAYCGRFEDKGIFHIREIKNAGELCADFKEAPRMLFCDTCRSCQKASGPANHLARLSEWRSVASGFQTADSGSIQRAYDSLQRDKENAISREIHQAATGAGKTRSRPEFYDRCAKYSTLTNNVLCRWKNYHGLCPGHSERGSEQDDVRSKRAEPKPRLWREGGGF